MSVDVNKPLPEDAEIEAAHPLKTGRHDLFAEAYRLVGAKHTKAALAELVNWLLSRITASDERAQRAERELQTACDTNIQLSADYAEAVKRCNHYSRSAEELASELGDIRPMAEEGRKAFVARRDALQMVADKNYRPDTQPLIYAEMEKAACEGEVRIDQFAGNPSEWFEITPGGRERLAYLRGLVGEEKAG